MKKLLALLLAISMIAAFAVTANAATEDESFDVYLQYLDSTYLWGTYSTPSAPYSTPATVTKSGTYTISWDVPESYTQTGVGVGMLYLNIMMPYTDWAKTDYTITNVKISIDGKAITLNQDDISCWASTLTDVTAGTACYDIYVPLATGYSHGMSSADANAVTVTKNITVSFDFTNPNESPKTGDSLSVFLGLMAVSAAGILVISKKKH